MVSTAFTFTGREWDEEAGLYYYRARYYDPNVGRFIQQDPHPGNISSPLTVLQKFSYAGNNPVKYIDPNGKWFFVAGLVASALAGGAYSSSRGGNFFSGALIGAGAFLAGAYLGGAAASYFGITGVGGGIVSMITGAFAGGIVGAIGFPAIGVGSSIEGFGVGVGLGALGGLAGALDPQWATPNIGSYSPGKWKSLLKADHWPNQIVDSHWFKESFVPFMNSVETIVVGYGAGPAGLYATHSCVSGNISGCPKPPDSYKESWSWDWNPQ